MLAIPPLFPHDKISTSCYIEKILLLTISPPKNSSKEISFWLIFFYIITNLSALTCYIFTFKRKNFFDLSNGIFPILICLCLFSFFYYIRFFVPFFQKAIISPSLKHSTIHAACMLFSLCLFSIILPSLTIPDVAIYKPWDNPNFYNLHFFDNLVFTSLALLLTALVWAKIILKIIKTPPKQWWNIITLSLTSVVIISLLIGKLKLVDFYSYILLSLIFTTPFFAWHFFTHLDKSIRLAEQKPTSTTTEEETPPSG